MPNLTAATPSLLPALLSFALVIALIPVALALLRRLRGPAATGTVRVRLVSSLNLGPRERVCVVQIGGRQLALGVTAHAISTLAELPPVPETSDGPQGTAGDDAEDAVDRRSPRSGANAFATVLGSVRKRLQGPLTGMLLAFCIVALAAPDSYAQTANGNARRAQAGAATPRTAAANAAAATATTAAPAAVARPSAPSSAAATGIAGNGTLTINGTPAAGGGTNYSVPIQTLLVFTALSFLPAMLLLMTSFTRLIIVLSLLRQAMGLQTTPPNQVLVGIALFLTFFIMGPTLDRVYAQAYKPYSEQRISFDQALESGAQPLRTFMLKQTRESDLSLFAGIAKADPATSPATVPMRILIPAFVTSELKTAFQIGFLVFIPFLIIDLIVASVLMSMGMMMLSPVLIALPFKLMLFVLADGWNLLMGSMVASFGTA